MPRALTPLVVAGLALQLHAADACPSRAAPEPIFEHETAGTGRFFVSPSGADADPGTERAPWRTLEAALPRLRPGDTLYVRGGTYAENVTGVRIRPGRADARVTVAAYPGERPVVVGLLWLPRPSYWTLDGINVTWSADNPPTRHMVKLTDGVGWVYQNSELWGARSYANLLVVGTVEGEPADWTLRGNCVHDTHPANHTSQDHNVYINTGTSAGPGLVERNVIFSAPNGANVKLGYGRSTPRPGDGAAYVTVRYNTMEGARVNLMVTDESHHNVIERNIVVGSSAGFAMRAYRLTGTGNVFRDNVFSKHRALQYADAGYAALTDGGGNRFPFDAGLASSGCGGLLPAGGAAQTYGRYAP